MLLTPEEISKLSKKQPIGDFHPFTTGDLFEVNSYLGKLCETINTKIPTLRAENMGGPVDMAIVEIEIYRKDDSERVITGEKDGVTFYQEEYLCLNLSRIAPLAAYGHCTWEGQLDSLNPDSDGNPEETRDGEMLAADKLFSLPSAKWEDEIKAILQILADFKIDLMPKELAETSVGVEDIENVFELVFQY